MVDQVQQKEAAAFWRNFARHERQLRQAVESGATGEKVIIPILDELKRSIELDVYLETSLHKDGTCELILSADGVKANLSAVKALADTAPKIPYWRIIAFRPRRYPRYKSINTNVGKVHVNDVQFMALNEPQISPEPGRLNIMLFVETLDDVSSKNRAWMLSLLLNLVIGEYKMMTRIGVAEHKTRLPLKAELQDQLRPLSDLPQLIDNLPNASMV